MAGVRQRFFPSHDIQSRYGFGLAADYNHRTQIVTFSQSRCEEPEPFDGRDHDADVAILEDVSDLVWLQQRVDWHKHSACRSGAKHRSDRFQAFLEADCHAFMARESQAQRSPCSPAYGLGERTVAQKLIPVPQ